MDDNTTPWQELREFASVDLSQSYILSWMIEREALLIDIDLFLCPDHAFYEKPRPSQGVCIRPAEIEFPFCTALTTDRTQGNDADISSIATSLGIGQITDLRRTGEGCYRLDGDFGTVDVVAERPLLRLKQ